MSKPFDDRKTPPEFTELLRAHLATLGWTAEQLADQSRAFSPLRLHPSQISTWLGRADRFVSREAMCLLAVTLAVGHGRRRAMLESRSKGDRESGLPSDLPGSSGEPRDDDGHAAPDGDPAPSALEWTKRYRGMVDLDAILADIRRALRYHAAAGNKDLVWQRFSGSMERELIVGWYHFPPFAVRVGGAEDPVGISRDVMDRVAAILGVRPVWRYCSVQKITPALLYGEVDVVCPEYLLIEPRLWDVWMSDPLPALRVHPACVVRRDMACELIDESNHAAVERAARARRRFSVWAPLHDKSRLDDDLNALDDDTLRSLALEVEDGGSPRSRRKRPATATRRRLIQQVGRRLGQLQIDKVVLVHTRTLVGQALAGMVAPSRGSGLDQRERHKPLDVGLDDAFADVRSRPRDHDVRIRVLVTDALTAWNACRQSDDALEIRMIRGEFDPVFGVGFALHPAEGGTLGRLINRAIERLRVQGAFPALYGPWRDALDQTDSLPTRRGTRIRETASQLTALLEAEYGDPNPSHSA